MSAAGSGTPHNSSRSDTTLRRLLLIAAAVFGILFVFVMTGPVVVNHFTSQKLAPALATAEDRSFSVLAPASGALQLGTGRTLVLRAAFGQAEDVQLKVGQSATVTVDAIPGLTLPAKVSSVETSATQIGGVPEYYAEILLSQSDSRLRNGQTGSVNVTVATANSVLSVPSGALFTGANNRTQVDVWSNGQAYATTVGIGEIGNTLAQITLGLQAGEQVMLSPAGQL
jgi:membrane fusion protein, macrolide-specific efflux system